MYDEDEYLSMSGIQHFSYCRRQWAIIHIEQQWEDNHFTYKGNKAHKVAHDANRREKRGDLIISRGLKVSSKLLGAVGECDVVEFHRVEVGSRLFGYEGYYDLIPIEYKSGHIKYDEADRLQLAAESIALEEMFCCDIPYGYLFYKGIRNE